MFILNRWQVIISKGNAIHGRNFMFYFMAYLYACMVTKDWVKLNKAKMDIDRDQYVGLKFGEYSVMIYQNYRTS